MDLRLLATFDAVASGGSVTIAARQLHLTQPAVSRQIQALEQSLGLTLLVRQGRTVRLSAEGERFWPQARQVLVAAESARTLAQNLASGGVRQVRIGAPSTTLTDVLAPFLAHLPADEPLLLVQEETTQSALALLGERLDLAMVTSPPPPRLASLTIAHLPVWAYVPADHPLAVRSHVRIDELADVRVLSLDPASSVRQLLDHELTQAGVRPDELLTCSNPTVAQALAAGGRGVAVVPDDPRFDLKQLPILAGGTLMSMTLWAAWDEQHPSAAVLRHLAMRLREWCAEQYGTAWE